MTGHTHVRAGRTHLTERVWFEINVHDDGTELALVDSRVNRRYSVHMLPDGTVLRRQIDQPAADCPPTASGQSAPGLAYPGGMADLVTGFAAPRLKGRLTPRMPSRIKLTIRYECRRQHRARVHGAYRHGKLTVLLVRRHWGGGVVDHLLGVVGDQFHVLPKHLDERTQIDDVDWDRFLSMPDGCTFRLWTTDWRKLSLKEVEWLNGVMLRPHAEREDRQ